MAPQIRKKVSISVLIPFLLFVLLFSIMIWLKYRSSHDVQVTPPMQNSEGARTVTLFFASGGSQLARETRDIEACEGVNECIKFVLDELLNGPVGELEETMPEGTAVDSILIEGKLATIDFNRTFSDALVSGSSAEMLAVYSVVNSVTANFPQIDKVKINVGGNKSTILKHLDLSEPLLSDYSLELLKKPVPE